MTAVEKPKKEVQQSGPKLGHIHPVQLPTYKYLINQGLSPKYYDDWLLQ